VNKTAASTAQFATAQFAFFFTLIHVYNCSSQMRENKQILHIAYLASWN